MSHESALLLLFRYPMPMWTVQNSLLTIFGVVLIVTPLAFWVAWTTTIFAGVLGAAAISLIGAVIVTRTKNS